MSIDRFNDLTETEVRKLLVRCLAVERWVDEVASGRPYVDQVDVRAQASQSAQQLSDKELAGALARHPRIGDKLPLDDAEAAQSSREQSGVDEDEATSAALRQGNLAYEGRFDRVFLIRAAGRSADEILSELERRLGNVEKTEREETVTQLREIALLRLDALLEHGSTQGRSSTLDVGGP